jgi:hypothetical protein
MYCNLKYFRERMRRGGNLLTKVKPISLGYETTVFQYPSTHSQKGNKIRYIFIARLKKITVSSKKRNYLEFFNITVVEARSCPVIWLKFLIFNKPHPAILLRITDKLVQYCILVLIQEIKRNIIFRRMQLSEPARLEVSKIRLQAHLISVTRKLISLLEYQGIVQNNAPISFLTTLNTTLISLVQ